MENTVLKVVMLSIFGLATTDGHAAGFKGIYIGEPEMALPPFTAIMPGKAVAYYEGLYQDNFFRINVDHGSVSLIIVVYSGHDLRSKVSVQKSISLVAALREHSLIIGGDPKLAIWRGADHEQYGIVDITNGIGYRFLGAVGGDVPLSEVWYFNESSPVLRASQSDVLRNPLYESLLDAARNVPLPSGGPILADIPDPYLMSSRAEAIRVLTERADVALGHGKRASAAMFNAEAWLTTDPRSSKARTAVAEMQEYWQSFLDDLQEMNRTAQTNEKWLQDDGDTVTGEPMALFAELNRKITQVRAMSGASTTAN